MAERRSKFNSFLIVLRDLFIVYLVGVALAVGGYFVGKSHGRDQALAEHGSHAKDDAKAQPSASE